MELDDEFLDELPEGHNQSAMRERKKAEEEKFERFIQRVLNDGRWIRVSYRQSQFCSYARKHYGDQLEFSTRELYNSGLLVRDTYIKRKKGKK